jgi:drug/metabolite transporter, DME family
VTAIREAELNPDGVPAPERRENPEQEIFVASAVRLGRLGVWCAIASSLIYTLTNILLRRLSTDVDPLLPSAVKATVTLLFFLPSVVLAIRAGQKMLPSPRGTAVLLFVSLLNQVVGNVGFQFSLGVLGMALAIPLCTGAMVIGSALMGRFILREPLHRGLLLALLVLSASIFLFRGGAEDARQSLIDAPLQELKQWSALAGVAAALLSGLAYAALSVTIRGVLARDVNRLTPILAVVLVGTVVLWPWALWKLEIAGLAAVAGWQWQLMLFAGLGNAVAFLFLAISLQLLPVAWVNAINVSQVGMAAVGGLLFFGEPSSLWLWIGLVVMATGFAMLVRHGTKKPAGETVG